MTITTRLMGKFLTIAYWTDMAMRIPEVIHGQHITLPNISVIKPSNDQAKIRTEFRFQRTASLGHTCKQTVAFSVELDVRCPAQFLQSGTVDILDLTTTVVFEQSFVQNPTFLLCRHSSTTLPSLYVRQLAINVDLKLR